MGMQRVNEWVGDLERHTFLAYIVHVQKYEGHQQPYCVGCEFHLRGLDDLRTLPPLERRPALSRVADVQVCSDHGSFEAMLAVIAPSMFLASLQDVAKEMQDVKVDLDV